jgi:tetratricopeptide (TPR) repeat protein
MMDRNKVALTAIVLATMGVLSAVDLFLARTEQRETHAEAEDDYAAGMRLLSENRALEAVDALRKAHALDRVNERYSLGLAHALLAAGKTGDAQSLLVETLGSSPNDGEANLLEARLMAREQKFEQAESYYHRAIYGTWSTDAAVRRVQVRVELADLLATRGSPQDLLAELLPLESEAHDSATRKRVAQLYLAAGSPARAAAAYRSLIHDDPSDHSNYAGLGEAELALGHDRAAETAFQTAGAKDRAEVAAEVDSLDPTVRRLSAAEKFARTTRVLERARDALQRCSAADPLLPNGDAELRKKIRTPTNEAAEERLTLAERLWDGRIAKCGPATDEEPLRLVLSKLR